MASNDCEERIVTGLIHTNIEMCLCYLKCSDVGTFDGTLQIIPKRIGLGWFPDKYPRQEITFLSFCAVQAAIGPQVLSIRNMTQKWQCVKAIQL